MLDRTFVRDNIDRVRKALADRRAETDVARFLEMDSQERTHRRQVEELRARRNRTSEEIGRLTRQGADTSELRREMREVGDRIKHLEGELAALEPLLKQFLQIIPNVPHASVPVGTDETANEVVRRVGESRPMDFAPRDHVELGTNLGILDMERATKIAGARFANYWGLGAKMERALIWFMLDVHTREHGYGEVFPPFIVNDEALFGTGQLPKFAADLFKIEGLNYYLVPTAEVPVTNLYRDEILEASQLPLRLAAYTACFRSEAGSYGKDTRGLIRQHQFNKVELVCFTRPEDSYTELERLTAAAEAILQKLELPYQVVALSTGDLGFAAAKTYDLEVWLPSQQRYREISSCSNFEDFQARRANIRFRPEPRGRTQLLHTLNGSGLAVGRTWVAIVENYQQADGSIRIPEALVPYMGGVTEIRGRS
ncbi:MAG: serine--tRNA ligase [Acidobacteria bacterium]|nr:serine--tRNA ligase [Acidobacteriota bacterium]